MNKTAKFALNLVVTTANFGTNLAVTTAKFKKSRKENTKKRASLSRYESSYPTKEALNAL